ncbi:MAG: crotonase/enoyl-CoA hydratase family protein [Rhizobiaceae bacterium]
MKLESTFFECRRDGAIFHLAMNRPEKANGMTPDFWADLPRLVREVETDPSVRVLVISGNGKHFTGGMDLSSFNDIANLSRNEAGRAAYALRALILKLQDSFNALEAARFPVIAAIHGACVGAGVDMTSACDIRLASEDAFFSIEEINIGMAADVGTLQRLPKLMAPGLVKELAYTGRRFSAREALQAGFVNAVHSEREATLAAALELAAQIAAKSPLAIAGIKKAVDYARDHSVTESLDQIATWNAGMLRPEDMMKAVQAKMSKQEALFADLMAS